MNVLVYLVPIALALGGARPRGFPVGDEATASSTISTAPPGARSRDDDLPDDKP